MRFKMPRLGPTIILGLVIGMFVPSAVFTLMGLSTQSTRLRQQQTKFIDKTIETIALGIAEPLWNYEKVAAEKLLDALIKDSQILHIEIKASDGSVFFEKHQEFKSESSIKRAQAIYREGAEIGSVEMLVSDNERHETLALLAKNALFSTLTQALLSIFMVYFLLRLRVLKPVSTLLNYAKKLSENHLDEAFEMGNQDELGELGQALDFARTELKKLFAVVATKNHELQALNNNLENLIEQRSATIKMILDHVKAGFMLVDSELNVLEGYTKSCQNLFQGRIKPGISLFELLQLKPRESLNYKLLVKQVFLGDMPEEAIIGQLPLRFQVHDKILSVEGSTVKNPKTQSVDYILFTVLDVTDLDEAEKENDRTRSIVNILRQRDSFISFVQESMFRITNAMNALNHSDHKTVLTELHTFKGNALAFGLKDLSQLAHELEESDVLRSEDLDDIVTGIRRFIEKYQDILEFDFKEQAEQRFHVNENDLRGLEKLIRNDNVSQLTQAKCDQWMAQIKRKSARSLLGPLQSYGRSLAERMGKTVDITLTGGDVLMVPEKTLPVLQTLTHALRNSIDHGIEESWQRGKKNPRAQIAISIQDEPGQWSIEFTDDGRGIDTGVLRQSLIEKKRYKAEELAEISEKEICWLAFRGKVSTAGQVTDVSGRGLGMGSILQVVQEVGAKLDFENRPGEGFRIFITIPKPSVLIQLEARVA